uniref:Uncharacterized protein n=1 Tax=Anguilla anguilla TaxID=7936 RepID=A0A0E9W0B5_ANGAN
MRGQNSLFVPRRFYCRSHVCTCSKRNAERKGAFLGCWAVIQSLF